MRHIEDMLQKMSTITGVTLVTSAAGNLFIGTYKTNMTNPAASVSFGRPYTGARPVKLSGYYKYEPHETNEGSGSVCGRIADGRM